MALDRMTGAIPLRHRMIAHGRWGGQEEPFQA